MRSLATSGYTAAEVEAVLRSGHVAHGCRVQMLDATLGDLGTLDGVTACTIDWNADRDIHATCRLTVLDTTTIPTDARLKPWCRIGIPGRGVAEYPMGVYLWRGSPQRERGDGTGDQTDDCPSLETLLDDGAPIAGYSVAAGTRVTDSIATVLGLAGITDTTGIASSTSTFSAARTWDIERGPNDLNTWRRILQDHHDALGYYSPWFDADGTYQAVPFADLTVADPTMTYGAAPDGITIVPLRSANRLERRANIVLARSDQPNSTITPATADANDIYPAHPWAERNLGRYIPTVVRSSAADTAALETVARNYLAERLSSYQTVGFSSLLWPVHELFDVIAVQWPGDDQFDTAQPFHERRWTADLFAGRMTHEARRIAR